MEMIFFGLTFLGYISTIFGITTYHHDKPENSTISKMALIMEEHIKQFNATLDPSERQKRLLPYSNYYRPQPLTRPQIAHNPIVGRPPINEQSYQIPNKNSYYEEKKKFTPFVSSNVIPGSFRPMVGHTQHSFPNIQYIRITQPSKLPDYSAIYDKLSRLKYSQNYERPVEVEPVRIVQPIPPQRFIVRPQGSYSPNPRFKIIQPGRTIIETFTPTNIDIPSESNNYHQEPKRYNKIIYKEKPFIPSQPSDLLDSVIPQSYQVVEAPGDSLRESYVPENPPEKPVTNPDLIFIQRRPATYEIPNYVDNAKIEHQNVKYSNYYVPKQQVPVKYLEKHQKYQSVEPYKAPDENSNGLNQILKQLQATNTLPESITTDNIDNSIRTLVKILEALKKRKTFSKPIVVQDIPADYEDANEEEKEDHQELDIISEHYPADTPEGGTPGKPGIDYPALSSIPQTNFNCKTQRYKGFFGDPATNCQVWHYCDLNGGQASFLCPNGTIFSQVALTCDWWYNVKCSNTPQLYVLNERLYKYIIPLSPKFPEDYTGPLVDKYLALKFNEMEEKMRKEKKGKERIGNDEKESTELQNVDNDSDVKTAPRQPNVGEVQQKETFETIEEESKH